MKAALKLLVPVILLLAAGPAGAQKSTEQFIPLGASPGLSGKVTDLGIIERVDRAARTIVLDGRSVSVTAATRIWIDKSKYRLASVAGGFIDLRVGRQIEVKYQGSRNRGQAEWIKVVPESPG